jgi:CBS domain-containing protein
MTKKIAVEKIMTKRVILISPETPVKKVAALMLKNKITGIPVVDKNKKLIGIVTETDLVFQATQLHLPTTLFLLDAFIPLTSPNEFEHEIQKLTGIKASDIMTKKVITLNKKDTLEKVATLIREKKVHVFPVVEKNKVIGIVGRSDLIKALTFS